MTAVLPLTEDEERALRETLRGSYPNGYVLRLLATLDAERAQRYPASVVEAVRALEALAKTWLNCERLSVAEKRADAALASLPKDLRDAARER